MFDLNTLLFPLLGHKRSFLVIFFIRNRLAVFFVALFPKSFQIFNSDCLIFELSTTFLEDHPLQLMICCEDHLKEHYPCRVHSDWNQNDTFFRLTRHKEVDIQEDKCQDCVVKQPISNKRYFLYQVPLNSFAAVAFSSPRHVIDIAEGIDKHDMRVCTLIDHIANAVEKQFEYKFSMCW